MINNIDAEALLSAISASSDTLYDESIALRKEVGRLRGQDEKERRQLRWIEVVNREMDYCAKLALHPLTQLPPDVDSNSYFELMLERIDNLKVLVEEKRAAFHDII